MATQEELHEKLMSATGEDRISCLLDYAFSFHTKDPEKALNLIQEAESLSLKHSCLEDLGRCHQMYSVYWGVKGNYDKALESALESLSLAQKTGRRDNACGLYNNLAIIYSRLKEHEKMQD